MRPVFSVVIPTYNRLDVLPEVLEALESQVGAPPFEVVVVDDGSSDGTAAWLERRASALPTRVLAQPNRGPAAARNRGVEAAAAPLVAFLGDDTVPSTGWLAVHHRVHRERRSDGPLAVLGYTRWHPRIRVTPFLHYVNEQGLQFGYALIDEPDDVPFNFFYTSNVSLPRELLLAEPFDLRFPYAAWEDTELAYRLTRRRGLKLVYEPRAVASHDHPTRLGRFVRRQEKVGYAAVVFYRLHPELGPFLGLAPTGPPPLPPRPRQLLREALARALQFLPVARPSLWEEVLRFHYIRGLHRGWNDRAGRQEGDDDVDRESELENAARHHPGGPRHPAARSADAIGRPADPP